MIQSTFGKMLFRFLLLFEREEERERETDRQTDRETNTNLFPGLVEHVEE